MKRIRYITLTLLAVMIAKIAHHVMVEEPQIWITACMGLVTLGIVGVFAWNELR